MRFLTLAIGLIWPLGVAADGLRVVADIPPVHALVARVMAGVAEPDLLLPPGASPHVNAMRPSQASALQGADVVFWIGPELTPWLENPAMTLAPDALHVALLSAEGTVVRPFRVFSGSDGEALHDDEGADAHGHGKAHDHGHTHEAGAADPHAWFDPQNAEAWLGAIAMTLGKADPANAATYAANATVGQAELQALQADLATRMAALSDIRLIVYHDAYQYFEAAFGLTALGSMTDGESTPSPRHMADLRAAASQPGACVVMEPQADPGLAEALAQGNATRVVTVDPQGRGLKPGVGYYQSLLRELADGLARCAG